ncbi:MAG TPA: Abi-alpha family protein [Gemmatimonadaceae bacterium]|nr:Abi-alpha family protein [Gemmatimonadaceae bacterium]
MSPDPVVTAAAVGAGAFAAKELVKPTLSALGERLRNKLLPQLPNPRNTERMHEELLERAADLLGARGIAPEAAREASQEIVTKALIGNVLSGSQSDLREMFANLLAQDMDPSATRPHPSYAATIQQLSGVEARMLFAIAATGRSQPIPNSVKSDSPQAPFLIGGPPPDMASLFSDSITIGEDFLTAVQNLRRLEIADTREEGDALNRKVVGARVVLLEYGQRFCAACIGKPSATGAANRSAR